MPLIFAVLLTWCNNICVSKDKELLWALDINLEDYNCQELSTLFVLSVSPPSISTYCMKLSRADPKPPSRLFFCWQGACLLPCLAQEIATALTSSDSWWARVILCCDLPSSPGFWETRIAGRPQFGKDMLLTLLRPLSPVWHPCWEGSHPPLTTYRCVHVH